MSVLKIAHDHNIVPRIDYLAIVVLLIMANVVGVILSILADVAEPSIVGGQAQVIAGLCTALLMRVTWVGKSPRCRAPLWAGISGLLASIIPVYIKESALLTIFPIAIILAPALRASCLGFGNVWLREPGGVALYLTVPLATILISEAPVPEVFMGTSMAFAWVYVIAVLTILLASVFWISIGLRNPTRYG